MGILEVDLRGEPESLAALTALPLPGDLLLEPSEDGLKLTVKVRPIPDHVSPVSFAERYAETLNAAGLLSHPATYRPVKVGTVRYGARLTYAWFDVTVFTREREFVELTSIPPPPITRDLISACLAEGAAREVLHFYCASRFDRYACWKVFELVRRDVGGTTALLKKGWLSQEAIASLRESINNSAFAGDFARHASIAEPQHGARSLSTSDVEEFLRRLVLHWLKSRTTATTV